MIIHIGKEVPKELSDAGYVETSSMHMGKGVWLLRLEKPEIKPEPPKSRTFWLGTCHVSSNPAWKVWEYNPPRGCSQCEVICVREVLEAPSVSNGNEKV